MSVDFKKLAGVMDDAAREGIELAKKLKAKNLVGGLKGNALKDYYHHMDLSAHPKFMQGVKTTAGLKPPAPKPMLKAASNMVSALEVGGLGILAKPSFHELKSKNPKERTKAKAELAGLGVLAAHPSYELAKSGIQKARKVLGKAPAALAKAASAHVLEKQALFKQLLGAAAKPAVKAPFKPSFAGHAAAIGAGAKKATNGVVTTKSWDPLRQAAAQSKHIEL